MTAGPTTTTGPDPSPQTLALARTEVKDLLLRSDAFRALPADAQREIANNTVRVAAYLAEPEGMRVPVATGGSEPADPYALSLEDPKERVIPARNNQFKSTPDAKKGQFVAQAAREGAAVAGALLDAVDFPNFVAGLIEGVFHAIVQSSIEQMEAYGKLVADVAKTLNEFRDENVSVNQGRDHLVEQFPDTFMIDVDTGADGGPGPRVRLRDGADETAALKQVNAMPIEGGPVSSLDDDTIEDRLVPAARTQLATSRQQLLATMVVMGIQRIVVDNGRIAAKVLYDFQARDTFHNQLSATNFDYGDQYKYASEGEYESDYQGGSYSRGKSGEEDRRGGSYYAKGKYKSTAEPVLKMVSATQQSTDASLTTKASLAGSVEVNFKSDYLPLEKMADSFQIGRIQDAAQPGRAGPAATTPAAVTPAATTPATAPQPAPAAPRP
jgi:hypothetical protein